MLLLDRLNLRGGEPDEIPPQTVPLHDTDRTERWNRKDSPLHRLHFVEALTNTILHRLATLLILAVALVCPVRIAAHLPLLCGHGHPFSTYCSRIRTTNG